MLHATGYLQMPEEGTGVLGAGVIGDYSMWVLEIDC